MNQQFTHSRLFGFFDLVLHNDRHSKKNTLHQERIHLLLVLRSLEMVHQRIEPAHHFTLKNSGNLTGTCHLVDLVFVDLSADRLEELLLLVTLVLSLLLENFHQFAALAGVGVDNFELSGFFLSERFGRDGSVHRCSGDLFEHLDLEILGVLVVEEFDLPLQEGHVALVPLQ